VGFFLPSFFFAVDYQRKSGAGGWDQLPGRKAFSFATDLSFKEKSSRFFTVTKKKLIS
jgi:hypothetical protein